MPIGLDVEWPWNNRGEDVLTRSTISSGPPSIGCVRTLQSQSILAPSWLLIESCEDEWDSLVVVPGNCTSLLLETLCREGRVGFGRNIELKGVRDCHDCKSEGGWKDEVVVQSGLKYNRVVRKSRCRRNGKRQDLVVSQTWHFQTVPSSVSV